MLELDLTAARAAIVPFAIRTPLVRAPDLDEHAGGDVYLKLENLQATGSFKVRGAASRMAALTAEERARGVVTCSSGNHGRAVAYVARRMGLSATICVPSWVDLVKLSAIEEAGAEAVVFGDTYDEAEAEAYRSPPVHPGPRPPGPALRRYAPRRAGPGHCSRKHVRRQSSIGAGPSPPLFPPYHIFLAPPPTHVGTS